MANEREADEQPAVTQADAPALAHAPHQAVRVVDDGRQPLGQAALGFAITASRHYIADALMRALVVVERQPGVEAPLHGGKIGKRHARDHLPLERAVEALVLALRLRVKRPAVNGLDP